MSINDNRIDYTSCSLPKLYGNKTRIKKKKLK